MYKLKKEGKERAARPYATPSRGLLKTLHKEQKEIYEKFHDSWSESMSHDEAAILSILLNYDIMREEETKPSKDYRVLCARMNNFNIEEKEKCISFGSAMSALEGTKLQRIFINLVVQTSKKRRRLTRVTLKVWYAVNKEKEF